MSSAPRLFQPRLGLLFAALLVPPGIFLPYFPLWLEWTGLAPTEIAVVLGAPMVLRVLATPVLSSLADRAADRANVLLFTVAASLLLSLGLLLPPGYALALAVSLGLAVFWPVQTSIADSIALSGVRRFNADYSRMRVFGSLSFLLANFGGGLMLARFGPASVPWMFAGSLFAALIVALLAPRLGQPRIDASQTGTGPLLRRRRLLLFMTAVGLIQSSHAFLWSFGSIYWKALGLDDATIGALWAFGIAAEVALFLAFTRFLSAVPALALSAMAGSAAILRWLLFPLIWPSGLGVAGFFAAQALHALSTGLLILATQKMIAESVPDRQTGAAQGIAYFSSNIGMAAATLASGPLYAEFGAAGFLVMAGIAASGLGLVVLAARSAP